MKIRLLISICLFAFILNVSGQKSGFMDNLSHYIENPAVFESGQEPGRAYYMPQNHQSLNGNWKFYWSDTPYKLPLGFQDTKFNDTKWDNISVPSNWEILGYGDKLFRNMNASFKANPPFVPKDYNPTGIYRKTFDIPADWKNKEIFLRFEKVASASFVWVNGKEVGYNEGAHEPAEYNITPYLKEGKNQLTVCVLKYCDGYYLETQDYWRLSGIFDDVTLYATPNVRLFDYQVITDLNDTYTDAELKISGIVKKYSGADVAQSYHLKAILSDKNGSNISEFISKFFDLKEVNNTTVSLSKQVKNPLKWTSEMPNLYKLTLQLIASNGKVVDTIESRIGFKKTEIKGEVFYLNGVPLKVNAQNSHMQHPETGHYVTEECIRKDFEILKQFNFNAVRTSHYPPTNKYLQLANEYGLYIIDEVGDEAHAAEWLSSKTGYAEMYKERCQKLVLRDRNYPCVLFWSAGNESGEGDNITQVIKEGKSLDPTRFWMYGGNTFSHPAEDIIGPRYPSPVELEIQVGVQSSNLDRRPSFMDEYLSVAGNGGGGMDDYWRIIYAHPRLMGGAIWDFVSPGLTERIRSVKDSSPYNTPAHLMGNTRLVKERNNTVLDLNGHDEWVEVYRQNNLEITGEQLTLSCKVFPRQLISSWGSFITKGNNQYGLEQRGKDSLEFYIYTDKKQILKTALPNNWEYNWHQLTAVYDGKDMSIYIDGEKTASREASGSIQNFPFPVNIGRNAEKHGQETSVYICDALIDDVAIFNKAILPGSLSPQSANMWLDFENETDEGSFYSYGIGARTYGSIWPDRTVQPEMWQMKKTVQPISFRMVDEESQTVEIWNRNHFLDASEYDITWTLSADDKVVQEGKIDLQTKPLSKETIQIAYTKPEIEAGKEYRIFISSRLKKDCLWAKKGHEVAWDQLELSWFKPLPEMPAIKGIIQTEETDNKLVVSGSGFAYIFDKEAGQLTGINYQGNQILKTPLVLNLWRAPLANEVDAWNSGTAQSGNWKQGFGNTIATEMYSAGIHNLTHQPIAFSFKKTDKKVHIYITNVELTSNGEKEKKDLYIEGVQCNGIRNEYEFIIAGDGRMQVKHSLYPDGKMPLWFPRIGLSMVFNNDFDQISWYGRGPQENYPDRKTGYAVGIYKAAADQMYEPYLLPQDYGLRTDNRWVHITNKAGKGIGFAIDQLFNFNAYPYDTDNLTKATYTYQLKKQDGITFNLDYATTGVGCTARGVFNSYRVAPSKYERIITIYPINP